MASDSGRAIWKWRAKRCAVASLSLMAISLAGCAMGNQAATAPTVNPAVSVSISPTSAAMLTNGMQQFTATISGATNTAVTWSASGGTVSSHGFYTAPNITGTFTVKATSAADDTKSASATVTVSAPVQHTVTLAWASTASVAGYNVYRSTVSGGPYTQINTALDASTNYVDSTVQSGTTYFYVVTSVDGSGAQSAFSNQVTAIVPTP